RSVLTDRNEQTTHRPKAKCVWSFRLSADRFLAKQALHNPERGSQECEQSSYRSFKGEHQRKVILPTDIRSLAQKKGAAEHAGGMRVKKPRQPRVRHETMLIGELDSAQEHPRPPRRTLGLGDRSELGVADGEIFR